MKKITTSLIALVLLAFASTAHAIPNFVDNNTALPATKTDRIPVTNPTQQWGAADANAVFGALTDIRTVLQRNAATVYNVKAFGATGAGIVDDSAAINAAIAAAAATRPDGTFGGTVYFPKGVYRIGTQIVLPGGVALRGDTPANTILRASNAFSGASLIKNQNQDGTQEYAFLEKLMIDGNAGGGAIETEAVVSWGSLFINSYMRDVIIHDGSAVGLHVFANGSPGGTGPVQFENLWVFHNGTHNVYIEDQSGNSGAFAGLVFINLTSEHQGSNSSAIYLKGNGHAGQVNFFNTHIEQGDDPFPAPAKVHRTGITIDGFNDVTFTGVQIQSGTPANIDAGIAITTAIQNLRIQIKGVTNINGINPILSDAKNSVTFGSGHLANYMTADVVWNGLTVFPLNGKSLIAQDSSGTARAWYDTNGRQTGLGAFGGATEILSAPQGTPGASDDRGWMVMDHSAGNPFGVYYPNGGGGALRERMFNSGQDVRQVATNGTVFWYQAQTFQSTPTFQSGVINQGNITSTGTIPTLSSCGTSPSILAGSTNTSGRFTTGSGTTTCTLTFSSAYTIAPTCQVNMQGTTGTPATPVYAETTTTIPMTSAVVASATYRYTCVGH